MIFYDTYSGRVLETDLTEKELKTEVEKLDNILTKDGMVTLNEYYDNVKAKAVVPSPYADMQGWGAVKGNCGHFRLVDLTIQGTEWVLPTIITPHIKMEES